MNWIFWALVLLGLLAFPHNVCLFSAHLKFTLPSNFSMVSYSPSFHNFVQLESDNTFPADPASLSLTLLATSVLNASFGPYYLTPDLTIGTFTASNSTSRSTYYVADGAAGAFSGHLEDPQFIWNFSSWGPGLNFIEMNPLIMGEFVFVLDCGYYAEIETPCNLRQLLKETGMEISRVTYPFHQSYVLQRGPIPSIIRNDQFYLMRGNITTENPDLQLLVIEVWSFSSDGMQLRDIVPLQQMGYAWGAADSPLSVSPDGRLLYAVIGPLPNFSDMMPPANIVVFEVDETGAVSHTPLSNLTVAGYVNRAVVLAPLSGAAIILRLSDFMATRDILVYSSDLTRLIWSTTVYGPYIYGGDGRIWPANSDPKPVVGLTNNENEVLFVSHDNYTLVAYDLRTAEVLWRLGNGSCSVSGHSAPLVLSLPIGKYKEAENQQEVVLVQGFCWPPGGSPYDNYTSRSVWLLDASSGYIHQEIDIGMGDSDGATHFSWAAPIQLANRSFNSSGCLSAFFGLGDISACPLGELVLCVCADCHRNSAANIVSISSEMLVSSANGSSIFL